MNKDTLSTINGALAAINFLIVAYLTGKYPGQFDWSLGHIVTVIMLTIGIAQTTISMLIGLSKYNEN